MQSANANSNWDFTAVIDFLHTPTKPSITSGKGATDEPDRNANGSNHRPSTILAREHSAAGDAAHTRLGDFNALWDVLRLPTVDSKSLDIRDARPPTSSSTATVTPSQPISILKRSRNIDSSKHRRRAALNQDTAGGILSDSTTGGESDGDISVFDSPVPPKSALAFIPSQIGAIEKPGALFTPPSSCEDDHVSSLNNLKKTTQQAPRYKSAAERKAGLMLKLQSNFPDFLDLNTSNSATSKACKVHVFVDASNISIGLHDSYKIQHGIPVSTHIRRLPLSFHNLSLILERGRPVVKRVLAGSDRFAAINEAEKIGYEVNILSRVHKAKEWTPRQLKFRNPLIQGIGSEMGTSPPERWVEQCVDEILHLKMLESLVDTDEPATIVLATGDAAEAEFSGGFMRMVERALQKEWNIELVSFAMNTSNAYKRKEFRAKWGSQFRMINLEDYVEEMLDM